MKLILNPLQCWIEVFKDAEKGTFFTWFAIGLAIGLMIHVLLF